MLVFSINLLKPKNFYFKKIAKNLAVSHKSNNFALANGSLAQLNRASDYGSEGYRFESCRSHKK